MLGPMAAAAHQLAARNGLIPWIARAPTLTDNDLREHAGADLAGLGFFDSDTL